MNLADRALTIAITATLTSAVWIVVGGSLIENAGANSQREVTRPAEAQPSPHTSTASNGPGTKLSSSKSSAGKLPVGASSKPPAISLDTDDVRSLDASASQQLMIPVLNIRPSDLTDTFAFEHAEGGRLHEAIDIMAPKGTTVVAAAPGTIEKIHASQTGGKTIFVRSVDRKTVFYYAHLSEYAQGLHKGQRIRRGQRIGAVGSTGSANPEAPHLHFAMSRTTAEAEWWEPANAINPYPFLTKAAAQ